VRTKTLVKNSIIQIDAHPFKNWYESHYGVEIGRKKKGKAKSADDDDGHKVSSEGKSSHVLRKLAQRQKLRVLDPAIDDQVAGGRLLACIASRPGQCGRCDGYVLEGKELEFYQKKLQAKKKGSKA